MDWLTLTDPFLRAALWIGIVAFALILALILQIISLRLDLRAREARNAAAIRRWRPIMTAVLADVRPDRLPALARKEEIDFFKLWLHYQSSLRGEARASLNWLAEELGCEPIALRMLERGGRGEKLLGVLVLGHMGHAEAFQALERMARGSDPLLAVHAAMALVQIDPSAAASRLAPELVSDISWPIREVVNILQGARLQASPVLVRLLGEYDEVLLPRLLQVMEGLRLTLPEKEMRRLLQHRSVEVQIGVLRLVSDPNAHHSVLAMLKHEDWRIRMHAAKALGRVGLREDVPALTVLLSDSEWWVRYRSAQVLAAMPFLKREELQRIAMGTRDRFAGDILRQVMAEAALAA